MLSRMLQRDMERHRVRGLLVGDSLVENSLLLFADGMILFLSEAQANFIYSFIL